jgi:hypothetical protein
VTDVLRRLLRLRSLSLAQWRVVLVSLLMLPAIQIALRCRGFGWTAHVLAARSDVTLRAADISEATAAAHAVSIVAGRPVVGARCLGRSLLLWFLLRRRGVDAILAVGALPAAQGDLDAHAWVEVDGRPVNDAADVRERYGNFGVELPRLQARTSDEGQSL